VKLEGKELRAMKGNGMEPVLLATSGGRFHMARGRFMTAPAFHRRRAA